MVGGGLLGRQLRPVGGLRAADDDRVPLIRALDYLQPRYDKSRSKMNISEIHRASNWASALFALGAASLWLWSATVKVPQTLTVIVEVKQSEGFGGGGGGMGSGFSPESNDLAKALGWQSKWSARAAVCAAAAAVFQAVALLTG